MTTEEISGNAWKKLDQVHVARKEVTYLIQLAEAEPYTVLCRDSAFQLKNCLETVQLSIWTKSNKPHFLTIHKSEGETLIDRDRGHHAHLMKHLSHPSFPSTANNSN